MRFGEFFSGPGGMSRGATDAARAVGIELLPHWAVDYDGSACRTYDRNHPGGVLSMMGDEGERPGIHTDQGDLPLVLNADVREVDIARLGEIDAFLFGFPCNDFSLAGEQKGLDGEFGNLYRRGLDVLHEKAPKFFVAENVRGLLSANDSTAFEKIVADLRCDGMPAEKGGGYEVTPHLYRFEEYGVPQTRHRILIVGIRRDIAGGLARPFMPPAPCGRTVTAREALSNIEPDAPNNEPKGVSSRVLRRLALIPPGKNVWDVNASLPADLKLNVKKTTISSIYRVLDPDKPAYTITGSGGGGTHVYHWDKRPTTDRERARLQTFPDDFVFEGGPQDVRRQIGMAVPPEGARVVIEAVLKTLTGEPYVGVSPNLVAESDPQIGAMKRERRARAKSAREAKLEARAERMAA